MAVPVHTSGGFTFGNPTKLFDARSYYFAAPNRSYDVTNDGQRFLMIKASASGAETSANPAKAVFVLNWLEELNARVPAKWRCSEDHPYWVRTRLGSCLVRAAWVKSTEPRTRWAEDSPLGRRAAVRVRGFIRRSRPSVVSTERCLLLAESAKLRGKADPCRLIPIVRPLTGDG
jgi:hypothetical protein